jgi:hypothetical protein
MKDVVANLDNDWWLTGDDVASFVHRHDASGLAGHALRTG